MIILDSSEEVFVTTEDNKKRMIEDYIMNKVNKKVPLAVLRNKEEVVAFLNRTGLSVSDIEELKVANIPLYDRELYKEMYREVGNDLKSSYSAFQTDLMFMVNELRDYIVVLPYKYFGDNDISIKLYRINTTDVFTIQTHLYELYFMNGVFIKVDTIPMMELITEISLDDILFNYKKQEITKEYIDSIKKSLLEFPISVFYNEEPKTSFQKLFVDAVGEECNSIEEAHSFILSLMIPIERGE